MKRQRQYDLTQALSRTAGDAASVKGLGLKGLRAGELIAKQPTVGRGWYLRSLVVRDWRRADHPAVLMNAHDRFAPRDSCRWATEKRIR